jgi:hypothetical protein
MVGLLIAHANTTEHPWMHSKYFNANNDRTCGLERGEGKARCAAFNRPSAGADGAVHALWGEGSSRSDPKLSSKAQRHAMDRMC